MKDGRGLFMTSLKKINIQRVKDYMDKNPDALKIDISRDLKMSQLTVRRHVASIESDNLKEEDE